MGNKIHPIGFRLGTVYTWTSRWFADKKRYADLVLEDAKLRNALMSKLRSAGISRVEIERSINRLSLILFVARPGMVIGRGGTGLEDLKKYIVNDILKIDEKSKTALKVEIKIEQIKEPNLDARLVAASVAEQLVKRLPSKRVLKQAAEKVMTAGAKGVRIRLGGRINGAEIARVEKIQEGILPFSTIKERVDFAACPAKTRSGYVGVKVWICLPDEKPNEK